ncbi:MAG: alanine:cation symporter family protein [Faecalicoccus sp.]|nr:alanine:cation symporter family protein [Faecalicoccus sp.]
MVDILQAIDDFLYVPILVLILILGGLYFSIRTGFVQIRLLKESIKLIMEPPASKGENHVSSFQALMVSTASRVGTGNIVGVSTAICVGGPGAVFWMWLIAIIGAASAFMESTLAQIYKRKNPDGSAYGGPAYYIEKALHAPMASVIFCIFLIATYAFGFNLLCSYNLQSTFAVYSFYNETTPYIVGAVIALLTAYCLFGGENRIIKMTSFIVPIMGVAYVIISLIVIIFNIGNIPAMFAEIFRDAFNFRAIFSGLTGSCMIYGIKRGLFSNEAGVGSAPNASASADVTHPVKQGLVQTVSVYLDTIVLCTASALMCLSTGIAHTPDVAGAPYVQNAISTVFGSIGPTFITIAMLLFGFTTLLGNLYYVDNALAYLNGKKVPSKKFMNYFYIVCVVVIFLGAIIPMDAAWALADITMGGMTIINIPSCLLMSKTALAALKDYEVQKKAGGPIVFMGKNIGLDESTIDFWK